MASSFVLLPPTEGPIMHPNPIYHGTNPAKDLAYLRDRSFGILSINGAHGPLAAHVPFIIAGDGKSIDLHLVRSNPIVRALEEAAEPALIAVSGSDSYISPDWYGIEDQVPTWNYIAIHVRGALELLPADTLPDLLDRLSAQFEARLLPKPPWLSGKVSPDQMTRFLRQIVPCRMAVRTVESTWKLNQNKPDEVRMRAAEAVSSAGLGTETDALARLMRNPDA